ncbi:MAG: response regulator, partial [Butyrivibrio sp.]|nr:response regulator [Butyrivibrio sp.]
IWLALTAVCVYTSLNAGELRIEAGGVVLVAFAIIPFLLTGALYGYFISLISFTVAFVISLLYNTDQAYMMSIFLVDVICFSMFSQYYYFKNKKKTIIATAVTLFFNSFIEMMCFSVVSESEYSFSKLWDIRFYILSDILIVCLTSLVIYLFFTKGPDICKCLFPLGMIYTKAFKDDEQMLRGIRKTKVSMKLTVMTILLEVLLGVFVAIFLVVLFPDIRDMFVTGVRNRDIFSGVDNGLAKEEIAQGIAQFEFKLTSGVISYDIKMMLLMLCAGVPMTGFANIYSTMNIGAPLGAMSEFMKEYAEADDEKKLEVGHKIDKMVVNTHDEIQVVHESIRETVHAVEEYINHIKEENELEKELEVAQKASEAKSSFLSNMSHEIRTPINAVLGLNEMIIREGTDPQILEYANGVKSAGNSLLGIINDILDFSKIEAGKMDILAVPYNLSSTINDLINLVQKRAENKGLEFKLDVDSKIPASLIGDEIRIKQCVTNILTNAVKYTEEGSVTMYVTYRKVDDENIFLRFRVVDTGIGIKQEDLDKLYSPFERIEEIRNRSIEGTGLGMSIVKKLLALMDTKLEVKSVYGEGSDFSFEVEQQVLYWEELGDYNAKYKEYLESQETYHEKFWAPDAQILVVDDTPINLTVVKGLLKYTKIKIDTAESGMDTLQMVREKKYDIIFIDHRMPDMDGIQTLEALKKLEDNLSKDAPCIALTANAGAGARDEYISAGFNDYLSKPVNGELLEDMIKEYLPKDKIQEVTADKSMAGPQDKDKEADKEEDVLEKLRGIDLSEAEKNCGSRDILRDVVAEFLTTIDPKADSIEKFASEGDYRNYTVAVHALKSSARLIGAMELSSMAAYLEECGNSVNVKEITQKTPELLELFRSYREKLGAIRGNEDQEDLPEIEEEDLKGAFSDMKELLEAYDFDTADGIMNMLSGYRIPEEYKEKYEKIKQLMSAVDRDALLEILED